MRALIDMVRQPRNGAAEEPVDNGGRDVDARYQAFVTGLPTRTKLDLAGWLRLIQAARFTDKNDIIDLLLGFGFTFHEASWLERTHHHNAGQFAPPDSDRATDQILSKRRNGSQQTPAAGSAYVTAGRNAVAARSKVRCAVAISWR